jgi:hypothetical protein
MCISSAASDRCPQNRDGNWRLADRLLSLTQIYSDIWVSRQMNFRFLCLSIFKAPDNRAPDISSPSSSYILLIIFNKGTYRRLKIPRALLPGAQLTGGSNFGADLYKIQQTRHPHEDLHITPIKIEFSTEHQKTWSRTAVFSTLPHSPIT